ncbi:MAG: CHAT domain-containing protein, partial [Anaerolineae bacterium]
MSEPYRNLDVYLTADHQLHATCQGDSAGPVALDLDENQIKLAQKIIVQERADPQLLRQVGRRLYDALLPAPVLALAERCRAAAPDHRLRLRLHVEATPLSGLPWELLHDGTTFLALRPDTSLVRYPQAAQTVQPLPVEGALRILVVIASPVNLPSLQSQLQADELKVTLGGLQTQGLVEVEFLTRATYAGLMRRLRSGGFHVLHYVGYSAFDSESQQPVLLFEEENGLARKVSGTDLHQLLYRDRAAETLRLVLLHDCERPTGPVQSFGLGVALRLVELGLPAVLTMQYSLPDAVARAFAAQVYAGIADGLSLDEAVFRGRDRIVDEIEAPAGPPAGDEAVPGEWAAPVLFMQSDDGQIFHPQPAQEASQAQASERIYAELDSFKVETRDRLTRLFLDYLPHLTAIGVAGTLLYVLVAGRLDLLFVSGVAVAYGCLWLLRSLFREKVPDTFDTLWRRGIILAKNGQNLARQYLDFLQDYDALLNDQRYPWFTRGLGLVVALVSVLGFNYGLVPQPWRILLQALVVVLVPLAGYLLGTLLWKMVATVLATRQLGERFDLDIHPTRPDGCGGLKPLGDLYFAHAGILLLAGLFIAGWLLIFVVSLPIVENHLTDHDPQQAALLDQYPALCDQYLTAGEAPDSAETAAFSPAVCDVLVRAMDPEPVTAAPHHLVVQVVVTLSDRQPPLLVGLALGALDYYAWVGLYQLLLFIVAVAAAVTFVYPMRKVHLIMVEKSPAFRHRADGMAAEIAELEKYIEQYGPRDRSESAEISYRLKWLEERYQCYNNPP